MKTGLELKQEFSHIKPLYDYGDYFVGWTRGTILKCYNDKKSEKICKIPMNSLKSILCKVRIFERIFRLFPRWGMSLDNNTLLVSFHGGIYRVDLKKKAAILEHSYVEGMNNSLSICKVENIEGFDDGLYYGEYTGKREGSEVAIWRRGLSALDKWECVYRFAKDSITHVHALIPDRYRDSIIVLTGDADEESGIWLAKNNFSTMDRIVGGKQLYRACVALPTEHGIIYATDTPLEQNSLVLLQQNNEKWEPVNIANMPGTTIYGEVLDEWLLISNTVEPDSRLEGFKYLLSNRIGPGIQDKNVRIYALNLKSFELRELSSEKKDFVPMTLGQFGTVMFANKSPEVKRILAYYMAVSKKDNTTVEIM